MGRMTAVIIDDEPLARRNIEVLLKAYDDVSLLASIGDAREALQFLKRTAVDVVFLDVKMPGMSGIELLETLDKQETDPLPHVIFVTAYDRFAIRAFDFHAVDYLVKPFSATRFDKALAAARTRRDQARQIQRLMAMMEDRQGVQAERLAVPQEDGLVNLALDQVTWIESADHYVVIHTRDENLIQRTSLTGLERKLPQFLRIHRSILVNPSHVNRLEIVAEGPVVLLSDGARLNVSRRRLASVRRVLRDQVPKA